MRRSNVRGDLRRNAGPRIFGVGTDDTESAIRGRPLASLALSGDFSTSDPHKVADRPFDGRTVDPPGKI